MPGNTRREPSGPARQAGDQGEGTRKPRLLPAAPEQERPASPRRRTRPRSAAQRGKPRPPRRPEPQPNPSRRPHYPATTPARAGAVGAGPTRAPEAPPPWRSRGGRRRLNAQRAPRSRRRGLPATVAALSAPRPDPPPSSPVLQIHLQDLPVALKEALHIALPGLVAQAADVHPRHPGGGWPRPPSGGGRRKESAAAAVTGGRRDGRSRSPATYASTQLENALPRPPPTPGGGEREGARARFPPGQSWGKGLPRGAPARGGAWPDERQLQHVFSRARRAIGTSPGSVCAGTRRAGGPAFVLFPRVFLRRSGLRVSIPVGSLWIRDLEPFSFSLRSLSLLYLPCSVVLTVMILGS